MNPESFYDSRYLFFIPNSMIYVHSGTIRIFYYTMEGKLPNDNNNNASQLLQLNPLVMYVDVQANQSIYIPSGRFFIIQALTEATVVVNKFCCGLSLKSQISSYRQLYDNVFASW